MSRRRRLTKVYVEIPPSPYDLSKYKPISITSSCVRRVPATQVNALSSASIRDIPVVHATLKRKTHNDDTQLNTSPVKKAKPDNVKATEDSFNDAGLGGFPSGFVYCHQCSQRRNPLASVQCTNFTTSLQSGKKTNAKLLRCTTKYCKSCLKNRYGEDLSQIKIGISLLSDDVENVGYSFKCPRCRNICNCKQCRKSKGSDPLGLTSVKKAFATPVNQQKKRDGISSRETSYPNKPVRGSFEHTIAISKWTRLHIPLDLSAIEDRIYIREFMLRFGRIMDPPISKNHLEELELIGGGFRSRDEYEDMVSWVSEACVKSMILGLLDLLAPECLNPEAVRSITKEIRPMGNNLSKLWIALRSLREVPQPKRSSSNKEPIHLAFPDPLPPPASATVYQTRSTRNAENTLSSIRIHCSAQLVPILVAFVDHATATNAIREEIEASYRNVKEEIQTSKEAIRLEHESWAKTRQALDDDVADKGRTQILNQRKVLHGAHKRRLLSIDKAVNIIMSSYASRFSGLLGKDDQGRLYWTITPGIEEISIARQFIASAHNESSELSRESAKEQMPRECNFKDWSRFLAIWGKPLENRNSHQDYKAGDNNDAEKGWWAIGEVDEIRNLATWLEARSSKSDTTLSKRIADFADLLEWRNRVNPDN